MSRQVRIKEWMQAMKRVVGKKVSRQASTSRQAQAGKQAGEEAWSSHYKGPW